MSVRSHSAQTPVGPRSYDRSSATYLPAPSRESQAVRPSNSRSRYQPFERAYTVATCAPSPREKFSKSRSVERIATTGLPDLGDASRSTANRPPRPVGRKAPGTSTPPSIGGDPSGGCSIEPPPTPVHGSPGTERRPK